MGNEPSKTEHITGAQNLYLQGKHVNFPLGCEEKELKGQNFSGVLRWYHMQGWHSLS